MALRIDAMRKTIRAKDPVRPTTKLAMPQGEERTTMARGHAIEMPRLILHNRSSQLSGLAPAGQLAGLLHATGELSFVELVGFLQLTVTLPCGYRCDPARGRRHG